MTAAEADRGPKGDKGDQGERGVSRLPGRQGWAIVALVIIVLLMDAVLLFWQSHETNVNEQAQQRAGQLIERKLCADIGTMAAIQPPAGSPAANPSRAYEQAEHRAWAGLASGLGCKGE